MQVSVVAAEVILDAIEDGRAQGSYKVWIAQETWFAGTMELDDCDTPPQCG